MAFDLLLKGGMVVTEGGGIVRADVAVSGEKIVGITAPGETNPAKRVVDIDGLHLLPGLIDMHSHPYAKTPAEVDAPGLWLARIDLPEAPDTPPTPA